MTQQTSRTNGFTLIELMLAMTFVSVLLLTIAMTVIQMGTTYNRGMTLKEVNQSARDISDSLRRSVQSAGVFAINADASDTANYVTLVNSDNKVVSGRLCLGNSSYIWNTASALEAEQAQKKVDDTLAHFLTSSNAVSETDINFVQIPDNGKVYCARDGDGALVQKDITAAAAAQAKELLKPGDRTIRMLSFVVDTTDEATDPSSGQQLYTVSYRLGTGETSAMEMGDDGTPTACLPPNDPNSNLTYCNVQQFSIVLRAGNAVN